MEPIFILNERHLREQVEPKFNSFFLVRLVLEIVGLAGFGGLVFFGSLARNSLPLLFICNGFGNNLATL